MPVKFNKSIFASVEKEVKREIVRQTEDVVTGAVDLVFNTEKTGRVYRRNSVEHQSSAPGQPFASDTGATVSQFDSEIREGGFVGAFVARGENAARLEFGTQKMEPRPFARPSLANNKQAIEQGLKDAVARGISKARP